MANKFQNARLFENRDELTKYCKQFLPESLSIAEVGVFQGYNSDTLINIFNPEKIFLIDTFFSNDHWTQKFTKEKHLEFVQNKFKNNPSVKILQGLSYEMLNVIDDRSLDYIYIDADHTYDGVKKDTNLSLQKIKKGGIIQFNDYTNYSIVEKHPYGVLDVVNELINSENVEVLGLGLHKRGYHDISIRIL
jgi:hypothetical protein